MSKLLGGLCIRKSWGDCKNVFVARMAKSFFSNASFLWAVGVWE